MLTLQVKSIHAPSRPHPTHPFPHSLSLPTCAALASAAALSLFAASRACWANCSFCWATDRMSLSLAPTSSRATVTFRGGNKL